jgi:ABC-type Na+ efflux pump permease subunit
MFRRSMVIARKEMREAFRSRIIKFSFVFLALMFGLILPIIFGSISIIGKTASNIGVVGFLPSDFFPDFTLGQRMYLFFLYAILSALLLIVPIALPIYIAADSFAGEKERKTIQQLLSTPLTDSEILLGKILTALIPTIITTYACVISTTIVVNLTWYFSYGAFQIIFPDLIALIQVVFLYPLLAFFGILVTVWASMRVNKVMEANQLGGIAIIPVMLIAFLPIIIGTMTSIYYAFIVVAAFAIADYGLFKVASRRFTREAILKRL